MGRDIVLPWSCDTNDIIRSVLFKIVLIAAPGALVFVLLEMVNPIIPLNQVDYNLVPLFVFGLLGTMFSWIYQILKWDEEGSLPSIRCKCDLDKNEESKYEIN